jgi:hypothetical protein
MGANDKKGKNPDTTPGTSQHWIDRSRTMNILTLLILCSYLGLGYISFHCCPVKTRTESVG